MNFKYVFFLLIAISPLANADIFINEIMYAPNANWGGENNEWIELFNNGTEDENVANWSIDGKNITEGTVPAKGYLILAKNATKFLEAYGKSSVRVPFTLSNSGKALYLKASDGSISDYFDYTEYATSGMAKNNNLTLERNGYAWFESALPGGTPEAQNSAPYSNSPPQAPVNNTENVTETMPPEDIAEEETNIQETQQNIGVPEPANIEILNAPDVVPFGGYSAIRARFKSGSKTFESVRFVAYIYKPSWISRDLNDNRTTLRNAPYNSNAAAEASGISANETYHIVLPLYLKCNTEGFTETSYTARVRAYAYENSEWKAIVESDKNIFVTGESGSCEKDITNEVCANKTIEKNCTPATKILREHALEINITHPETVFAGENFSTSVFVKNNGEDLRDLEIYSYMYEHGTIISRGFDGIKWGGARAANSKKITLAANDSITVELVNRAKENASAEKYTYKVRFDDLVDDKKSEERISLIELSVRNISNAGNANETFSNAFENENKITGNLLAENAVPKKMSLFDRIIYKIKSWLA